MSYRKSQTFLSLLTTHRWRELRRIVFGREHASCYSTMSKVWNGGSWSVPECFFKPGGLHPANPGDILHGRYEIKAAHSWAGTTDTDSDGGYRTYLAKNGTSSQMVCLRIYGAETSQAPKIRQERDWLQKHLSDPDGILSKQHLIIPLDKFPLQGPNEKHLCSVYVLHGLDLIYLPNQYATDSEGNSLPPAVYEKIIYYLDITIHAEDISKS